MAKRSALVRARKQKGWTQTEVAVQLGIAHQTYSHWETGRIKYPPVKRMVAAEELFEEPKETLFPDVFGA